MFKYMFGNISIINGACCSKWGNCGYGPDFCGGNCLSNCQAKSECGKYGKVEKCPLNVCCSEFGFCGTTEDFCSTAKKCQNNCGNKKLPKCSNGNNGKLLEIGYYASWAAYRKCHPYSMKNIDPRSYTHLNYAFGNISNGVMIDPNTSNELSEIKQFTGLKQINPSLKVLVSVGGWTFNDPGPTRQEFHNIISTQNARNRFIRSVRKYLEKHHFDGIDIDYEYPAAEDRGGSPIDTDNYVTLIKELRNALGKKYLITIAAPASYWYLRHFKIGEMSKYLDFINVMTYDIHGVWDRDIKSLGPYVKSHTNMEEIEQAFELFLRDGVKSDQLVFGLGYYGRSFTLESPSCKNLGCKFSGPGDPGSCTNSSGTLAWFEIEEIIAKNHQKTVKLDSSSMSKILTWGNNQWVAYDDEETLSMRRQYAKEHCLRGVMIWSIDQGLNREHDNSHHTLSKPGNVRNKRAGPSSSKTCGVSSTALLYIATAYIPIVSDILREIYQRLIRSPSGTRVINPNDPNNPIQQTIVRTVTHGRFTGRVQTERVEFVVATITPLHYRRNHRVNFPDSGNTSTDYMRQNMNGLVEDERDHIVASMFSGPPELYNMFPQHRSLNRNYRQSHLLVDWYQTELRIREHLENNRGSVRWEVALSYDDDSEYSSTEFFDRILGTLRNCEGEMVLPNGRRCGL
ncbi:hypothetical protein I4U23_013052 [Adineta vaga]|nr:hypothetical protein I4U23_013052 [Adineta vaga]